MSSSFASGSPGVPMRRRFDQQALLPRQSTSPCREADSPAPDLLLLEHVTATVPRRALTAAAKRYVVLHAPRVVPGLAVATAAALGAAPEPRSAAAAAAAAAPSAAAPEHAAPLQAAAVAATAAAAAVAAAAAESPSRRDCPVCCSKFVGLDAVDSATAAPVKMVCCAGLVCRGCVQRMLTQRGLQKVCPHCISPWPAAWQVEVAAAHKARAAQALREERSARAFMLSGAAGGGR